MASYSVSFFTELIDEGWILNFTRIHKRLITIYICARLTEMSRGHLQSLKLKNEIEQRRGKPVFLKPI